MALVTFFLFDYDVERQRAVLTSKPGATSTLHSSHTHTLTHTENSMSSLHGQPNPLFLMQALNRDMCASVFYTFPTWKHANRLTPKNIKQNYL